MDEPVKIRPDRPFLRDLLFYFNVAWVVSVLVFCALYYLWSRDVRLDLTIAGSTLAALFLWALLVHARFQLRRFKRILRIFQKAKAFSEDPEFKQKISLWNAEVRIDAFMSRFMDLMQDYEKDRVTSRHTLDKYLGSRAAQHALQSTDYALGGRLQKVLVVFTDIRGFTSMAEKLTPQETMKLLNHFYSSLETVITKYGGEINKFIGDAILVYFTAVEGREQSLAHKVVDMCMDMKDKFEEACRHPEVKHHNVDVGLGIGAILGDAILGNLGSRQRMEFTLIGDTVNLASRICSIAASGEILLNEELAVLVSDRFYIDTLPPVQLKGKSERIVPFCIMGRMNRR